MQQQGLFASVPALSVVPGSQTFNSGSGNFVTPIYNTLVIDVYGGGAAGGLFGTASLNFQGQDGNASTVSTYSLTAGGGKKSASDQTTPIGGVGGTASGGNTTNTNGNPGGGGFSNSSGTFVAGNSGPGGACPGGGGAGGASAAAINGLQATAGGNASAPGGGGGGGMQSVAPVGTLVWAGYGGGGSGAFVRHVLTALGGGPAPGTNIAYSVGAAVTGGSHAGDGAAGRVVFTWV